MVAAVVTASASVFVAVLAFILSQQGQVRQERRQARLARINSQLRDLYGPLNALVEVNEQIWATLRGLHLPPKAERMRDRASMEWQYWKDGALMPINLKMRDTILNNADLLSESEFPRALLDFCSHVAALEVQPTELPYSHSVTIHIPHPGTPYVDYVRTTFKRLKAEQAVLLRAASGQ